MRRRLSQARLAANRNRRSGLTTFFSLYIGAQKETDPKAVWFNLCEELGVPGDGALKVWKLLCIQYCSQTTRLYHNMDHIRDCLALLSVVPIRPEDETALKLAIFFHDAVYDTWAKDNEERSLEFGLFCFGLMGLGDRVLLAHQLKILIMATSHRQVCINNLDAMLIADIDLYSLSLSKSEFDKKTEYIRHEFGWVLPKEFCRGRIDFFQKMLDGRLSIYQTYWFRAKFERSARRNIIGSIKELTLALSA